MPVRTAEGFTIYANPRIQGALWLQGGWEKLTIDLLKRELKPGMVFIDIGAYIGCHTLLAAKLVGESGRVFAFEPAPDTFTLLRHNVEINEFKNVSLSNKACLDKTCRVKLFVDESHPDISSVGTLPGVNSSILVDAVSLDEFFSNYQGTIDFIKIDIEGAELAALDGMARILEKHRHLKMIVEFAPFLLYRCKSSPDTLLKRLISYGFELRCVLDEVNGRIEFWDVSTLLINAGHDERSWNLFLER
jgi:FkbM family methyltransferase